MTTGTRGTYQRAVDKATELRTYAKVQDQGHGVYLVPAAADGIFYAVQVDGRGEYSCSCRAGQLERVCYHAAGVWIHRLGLQAAGGAIAAPAPAATPARRSDAETRAAILEESRAHT